MDITKLLNSYVNNEKINIEINDSDLKLLFEQSLSSKDDVNHFFDFLLSAARV